MDPGPTTPDEQLILLSKDGNLRAFNRLVERYQRPVYNLCYRLIGSRQAAEDATQEAFLAAFRGVGNFHGGSVKAWFYRIAANESRDELRRRRRKDPAVSLDQPVTEGGDPPDIADPLVNVEAEAERGNLFQIVRRALDGLPEEQRLAIVLVDFEDHDYRQVVEITGWSMGTVKSRINRGRAHLRVYFTQHPELLAGYRRLDRRGE